MKATIGFLFLFSLVSSRAHSLDECSQIKIEQVKLATAAMNLANAKTTRTPEGGPYKPRVILKCQNGDCEFEQKVAKPLLQYLPSHPDADEQGYVGFPNISLPGEYARLNAAAAKLRLLASKKVCVQGFIDNSTSALIEYLPNSSVRDDFFTFNRSHQVVSWSRSDSDGKSTTTNFRSNGETASY